jgi:hypothetical protein
MGVSPPAQNYGQLPGKATVDIQQFNAPNAQSYVPPPKQSSKAPWIIGLLLLLLILIGGAIAAAIFIPPMLRANVNDNKPRPTPTRSVGNATPTPIVKSTPDDVEENDVPNDDDEVLAQLHKLEQEWTQANIKGDKQVLERILAEEYVGGPTAHSKREYIDTLKPDPEVKSWELKDLTVEQDGDRATVKGTLTQETTKGTETYDFTDKFVWRDHRWQAVSSKNGPVKNGPVKN